MADKISTVQHEELGPDGFVVRDAVPTSDVIRIRFADIDGLRALAIVLVGISLIAHLTLHGMSPLVDRIATTAGQGLALFIVLSGFSLAFPPLAVLRQDGRTYLDIGRYAIRRILRIYPAYLAALALTAVLASITAKSGVAGFQNVTPAGILANLFFVGDGFGNDGFRVLGLFARAYVLFPGLVWLWSRKPAAFAGLGIAFVIVDALTPAHAWSLGAFFPFMLGIVAADLRAQSNPIARFAPALVVVGAALAIFVDPVLATLPGAQSAPQAFAIDPFWSLTAFGLVVSVAALRPLEKLFGFWMFRVVGASSYSLSLVLVPTTTLLAALTPTYAAALAVPLCFVAGFGFWQVVDRWFNDGNFRRNAASAGAPPIDALLAKLRADRVFLGTALHDADADTPSDHQEEFVPNFYAPPPRPTVADLAIVSRRTGSPEELAAEILETKARLQERSAEFFGDTAAISAPVYPKPGFYRKQATEANLPFEDVEDPFASAPSVPIPVAHQVTHQVMQQSHPMTHAKPASDAATGNGNGGGGIRIRIGAPIDGAFNG